MRILKRSLALLICLSLFSCVEDEIVFRDKNDLISFDRSLLSVAEDETPEIKVNIVSVDGEDQKSLYNINYSSSDETVFTIDNNGKLNPKENSIGKKASIIVSAVKKSSTNSSNTTTDNAKVSKTSNILTLNTSFNAEDLIEPEQDDEVVIGRVTISESEALSFTEEEIEKIIKDGFTPKGLINNPISQIDIEDTETTLSATFFDFKNQDLKDPVLQWKSSDTTILDIDENGTLNPLKKGEVSITVSTVIDEEEITTDPLTITVAGETVIVDQPVEADEEILGFGTFMTNSFYQVEGTFRIVKKNNTTEIVINDNFKTGSGIPDLVIYLSNSTDTNTGAQIISEDINLSGAQSFVIPNTIEVGKYKNVLLYCRAFGVKVGFGVINK